MYISSSLLLVWKLLIQNNRGDKTWNHNRIINRVVYIKYLFILLKVSVELQQHKVHIFKMKIIKTNNQKNHQIFKLKRLFQFIAILNISFYKIYIQFVSNCMLRLNWIFDLPLGVYYYKISYLIISERSSLNKYIEFLVYYIQSIFCIYCLLWKCRHGYKLI